ncbi:hypothetical protein KJ996_05715 [Patescibacteria group bacterium]|nr:hypothetical protein [Patescibacteria group bacterium]
MYFNNEAPLPPACRAVVPRMRDEGWWRKGSGPACRQAGMEVDRVQ